MVFWNSARAKAGLPEAPCPLEYLLNNKLPELAPAFAPPQPVVIE
jgi:hypothetical protein